MPDYIAPILLFAIALFLTFAIRCFNVRKENRGKQILSLYLTPFVALAGIVLASLYYSQIDLPQIALLNEVLSIDRIAVWNLIIIGMYLMVKGVCMAFSPLWDKGSAMEATIGRWYEYDEDENHWFLKQRFVGLRQLASALTWAVGVILGIVLALSASNSVFGFEIIAWPSAALVIVAEVYNFLSGLTKKEWLHAVGGEGIGATRIRAYYKLKRVYEKLFPSAMLYSKIGNEYSGKVGATEKIEMLRSSDDEVKEAIGVYFDRLPKKNGFFDVDLIGATVNLMQGENVVFFNPHYRDLSEYLVLPMVNTLLNNKKCLVVVGRNGSKDDVLTWLRNTLGSYTRAKRMWRTEELCSDGAKCEVGILPFCKLYDAKTLKANEEFLTSTEFVLLVEPSRMLATSQIGLNLLAERVNANGRAVYAVCDHESDGLVDTLSHILQTDITHAYSLPVPRSVYAAIGWSACGDFIRQQLFGKQTHYLGNGIELASVALRNQVPHITWLSEEKVPVRDIQWIAGQYYPQICKYANLPNQQSSLEERMTFSSNLWGMPTGHAEFIIAEDELCNLFATMRAYLTRGDEQAFVNVISESYLLRDYMRCNGQLFLRDPKAVPAITPGFVRTARNTTISLVYRMAYEAVSEDCISHELEILGCNTNDVYSQLCSMISTYTGIKEEIISISHTVAGADDPLAAQTTRYSISEEAFNTHFSMNLKNAWFVVEDEQFELEYLDSKLFGHITQMAMPGQLLTYQGKYYKVCSIEPNLGCILHRAADSYLGRKYYKQLRTYTLDAGGDTVSSRKIGDMRLIVEQRDFQVTSTGYLEMCDAHDLRTARYIDLSANPDIKYYKRTYKNKRILNVILPDMDNRMRFTICMLLSELSKTIFPYAWQYIAFVCKRPFDVEGMLDKYNYSIQGAVDDEAIVVIEDSDMDLGLIDAIENNIQRLFEILADYLDWHFEKMKEPASKDPVLDPVIVPEDRKPKKKRNPLQRISQRLANIFARKRDDELDEPREEPLDAERDHSTDYEPPDSSVEIEEGTAQAESSPFEVVDGLESQEKPGEPTAESGLHGVEEYDFGEEHQHDFEGSQEEGRDADEVVSSGPDMPYEQLAIPEEETLNVIDDKSATPGSDYDDIAPIELMEEYKVAPSRYQRECFLKFGFEDIDDRLQIEKVASYFAARGWTDNDLTKSRHRDELDAELLDLNAENTCDFCGLPLSGVSYDKLADGRTRCNDCSMTAIDDLEEYKKLFRYVEIMMESSFGITMPVSIDVRTTDARTLAKASGSVFRPSSGVAPRTLGFASVRRGRYSLFVENGSPRLAAIDTTAHELTHIWQYINWKDDAVEQIYRMPGRECTARAKDIVYEGMACWASVQILYLMGETHYARQQELLYERRNDVYGKGFVLYRERYGLEKSGEAPAISPFGPFPTLEIEDVLNASKLLCTRKAEDCVC